MYLSFNCIIHFLLFWYILYFVTYYASFLVSKGISNGIMAIGVFALIIFVPAIAYFIYVVYKDPATPDVFAGI